MCSPACSRAVGEEGIPGELQRGCRRLLAATGRQQKTGSSTRAGGGQGQSWGAVSALSCPHPWDLRKGPVGRCAGSQGILGAALWSYPRCSPALTAPATWVCAPQLTAGHQPWALSVCPGQLMAPCSVEIILPFYFSAHFYPPALCNNQMLGLVLKS